MSDQDHSQDPWARWRKPAAPTVDTPAPAKSAEPVLEPAAVAPSDGEPGEVVGNAERRTLGVNKAAKAAAEAERLQKKAARFEKQKPAGKDRPSGTARPARAEGSKPSSGKPRGDGAPRAPRDNAVDPWAQARRGDASFKKPARPQSERAERPAAPVEKAGVAASTVADRPTPSGVRLSKVMSERGLCSRREADLWIERGWVFVNGEQVAELGARIDPAAEITISQEAKRDQAKAVTILLHKPVGYVSGQPEPGCVPAVTLITEENQLPQSGDQPFKPWMLRGLAPAGRLDVDSTGLLVLTSDGRVAKKLIGEDSQAEKEYLVRVDGQMIPGGLELLRHGLELDGKPLKPAWVKQLNEDQLHFILKEGKKRQIRRMCELVGLKVIGLKRVRIGRIRLGDLPLGQWRFLRQDEAF